jgi:hypothetical protein
MSATLIEAVEARRLFATFVVTTAADGGAGSLRQAILDSNANDTPTPVDDAITFNIPGSGVRTIALSSPLPQISGNVTVDATSQPGYDTNHTPVVEIDGGGAGAGAAGLRIASTGPVAASTVLGLIINHFSGPGVVISGDYNYVAQCYIGTDATGEAAGPGNGSHGVVVTGDFNFVTENVIAFNAGNGINVDAGAVGNTLAPNSVFSNTGMAIDLGGDGATPNDAGDADDGANRRQNFPVITSVGPAPAPATGLRVAGTINTTPRTLIEVTLSASPTNDGEGRTVLMVLPPFETDASGNGSFAANVSGSFGDWITATATSYVFVGAGSETNTSEFSPPVTQSATPTLQAVYVRGSTWAPPSPDTVTFMEYLQGQGLGDERYGYRLDAASGTDTVPWTNVDEIVMRWSGPVTLPAAGSVTVDGVRSDYTVQSVTSPEPGVVVLRLDRPLGAQPAAAGGGENGDRVRLVAPGVSPDVRFNVLQGDVDRSTSVVATDFSDVKRRFFRSTAAPGPAGDTAYSPFADIDASGSILANDFSAVKSRFFDNLPAPAAAAPFSASRIADDVLS